MEWRAVAVVLRRGGGVKLVGLLMGRWDESGVPPVFVRRVSLSSSENDDSELNEPSLSEPAFLVVWDNLCFRLLSWEGAIL